MSDIAAEAGVAHGLVYHYFANKEAMLREALAGTWSLVARVVDAAAADDDPRRALSSVAGFVLEACRLDPPRVKVALVEGLRGRAFLDPDQQGAFHRIVETLATLLDKHHRAARLHAPRPRALALLFLGQLEVLVSAFVAGDLLDAGDDPFILRDLVVDTFLDGCRLPPTRSP